MVVIACVAIRKDADDCVRMSTGFSGRNAPNKKRTRERESLGFLGERFAVFLACTRSFSFLELFLLWVA